ncbi:MAG: hypothetical protein FJ290_18380 [Planctomycetes bacterium]|nr:hypothetical protein [Planctomycetota bacterium]
MALALRKIRLTRWHREEEHDLSWVPQGDIVADPLADLTTTNGKLSVWLVEEDLSNLSRVLAAFATTADRLANLDYVLFDPVLLTPLGVGLEHTQGGTADGEANQLWHRDLSHLSGHTVVELARAIKAQGREGRATPRQLRQLIVQAGEAGQVDWDVLNAGIRKDIAG